MSGFELVLPASPTLDSSDEDPDGLETDREMSVILPIAEEKREATREHQSIEQKQTIPNAPLAAAVAPVDIDLQPHDRDHQQQQQSAEAHIEIPAPIPTPIPTLTLTPTPMHIDTDSDIPISTPIVESTIAMQIDEPRDSPVDSAPPSMSLQPAATAIPLDPHTEADVEADNAELNQSNGPSAHPPNPTPLVPQPVLPPPTLTLCRECDGAMAAPADCVWTDQCSRCETNKKSSEVDSPANDRTVETTPNARHTDRIEAHSSLAPSGSHESSSARASHLAAAPTIVPPAASNPPTKASLVASSTAHSNRTAVSSLASLPTPNQPVPTISLVPPPSSHVGLTSTPAFFDLIYSGMILPVFSPGDDARPITFQMSKSDPKPLLQAHSRWKRALDRHQREEEADQQGQNRRTPNKIASSHLALATAYSLMGEELYAHASSAAAESSKAQRWMDQAKKCFQMDLLYTRMNHAVIGDAKADKQLLIVPLRRLGEVATKLGKHHVAVRFLLEYAHVALSCAPLARQQEAFVCLGLAAADWHEDWSRSIGALPSWIQTQVLQRPDEWHETLLKESEYFCQRAVDMAIELAIGKTKKHATATTAKHNVAPIKLVKMHNAQNNLVNAISASLQFRRLAMQREERSLLLQRQTHRIQSLEDAAAHNSDDHDAPGDASVAHSDTLAGAASNHGDASLTAPSATYTAPSAADAYQQPSSTITSRAQIPASLRDDFDRAWLAAQQSVEDARGTGKGSLSLQSRAQHTWGLLCDAVGWVDEAASKTRASIKLLYGTERRKAGGFDSLFQGLDALLIYESKARHFDACKEVLQQWEVALSEAPVRFNYKLPELLRWKDDLASIARIESKVTRLEVDLNSMPRFADSELLSRATQLAKKIGDKNKVLATLSPLNKSAYLHAALRAYLRGIDSLRRLRLAGPPRQKGVTAASTAAEGEDDELISIADTPTTEVTHHDAIQSHRRHCAESEARMYGLACGVATDLLAAATTIGLDAPAHIEQAFIQSLYQAQERLYALSGNVAQRVDTLRVMSDKLDGLGAPTLKTLAWRHQALELAKQLMITNDAPEPRTDDHADDDGPMKMEIDSSQPAPAIAIAPRPQPADPPSTTPPPSHFLAMALQRDLLEKLADQTWIIERLEREEAAGKKSSVGETTAPDSVVITETDEKSSLPSPADLSTKGLRARLDHDRSALRASHEALVSSLGVPKLRAHLTRALEEMYASASTRESEDSDAEQIEKDDAADEGTGAEENDDAHEDGDDDDDEDVHSVHANDFEDDLPLNLLTLQTNAARRTSRSHDTGDDDDDDGDDDAAASKSKRTKLSSAKATKAATKPKRRREPGVVHTQQPSDLSATAHLKPIGDQETSSSSDSSSSSSSSSSSDSSDSSSDASAVVREATREANRIKRAQRDARREERIAAADRADAAEEEDRATRREPKKAKIAHAQIPSAVPNSRPQHVPSASPPLPSDSSSPPSSFTRNDDLLLFGSSVSPDPWAPRSSVVLNDADAADRRREERMARWQEESQSQSQASEQIDPSDDEEQRRYDRAPALIHVEDVDRLIANRRKANKTKSSRQSAGSRHPHRSRSPSPRSDDDEDSLDGFIVDDVPRNHRSKRPPRSDRTRNIRVSIDVATGGTKKRSKLASALADSRARLKRVQRELDGMAGFDSGIRLGGLARGGGPSRDVADEATITIRMAAIRYIDPVEYHRLKIVREMIRDGRARSKQRTRDTRQAGADARRAGGSYWINAQEQLQPTVPTIALTPATPNATHAAAQRQQPNAVTPVHVVDVTQDSPEEESLPRPHAHAGTVSLPSHPKPPAATRLRTKDQSLYMIRVHIPSVSGVPAYMPHAVTFWLRYGVEDATTTKLLDELKSGLFDCQALPPTTSLAAMLDLIRDRLWLGSGVRLELSGLGANVSSPALPLDSPVTDAFPCLSNFPSDQLEAYQLPQTVDTHTHRVTFYRPTDITGTLSKQRESVLQKVTLISTELCVREASLKPVGMTDKYSTLCRAMNMHPHPYLLHVLQSNPDPSTPTSIVVDRCAEYLTPDAMQPMLLALEADDARLKTMRLETNSFDEECAHTLIHILQRPTAPGLQLTGLAQLSLARSNVRIDTWNTLLPALTVLSSLTALDLSFTSIGDANLHALDVLLTSAGLDSLLSLNLSGCSNLTGASDPLGAAGVITCHTGIQHYALDQTPITHQCIVHIMRFLEERDQLQSLSLAFLPCMRDPIAHSVLLAGGDHRMRSPVVVPLDLPARAPVSMIDSDDELVLEDADMAAEVTVAGGNDHHHGAGGVSTGTTGALVDIDAYESFEYAPTIDTPIPSLSTDELHRRDTILQALLEFNIAFAQCEDHQRSQATINLRGWHNTLIAPSQFGGVSSLFHVIMQSMQSPRCRIGAIDLRDTALDIDQRKRLAALSQRVILD